MHSGLSLSLIQLFIEMLLWKPVQAQGFKLYVRELLMVGRTSANAAMPGNGLACGK